MGDGGLSVGCSLESGGEGRCDGTCLRARAPCDSGAEGLRPQEQPEHRPAGSCATGVNTGVKTGVKAGVKTGVRRAGGTAACAATRRVARQNRLAAEPARSRAGKTRVGRRPRGGRTGAHSASGLHPGADVTAGDLSVALTTWRGSVRHFRCRIAWLGPRRAEPRP